MATWRMRLVISICSSAAFFLAAQATMVCAQQAPPVSIVLGQRHSHVTPSKGRFAHTAGGLIDVSMPAPDTLIVTMTGAVVANASLTLDLDQCFDVQFNDPKLKRAKLLIEGQVAGILRGERKGNAEYAVACAKVLAGSTNLAAVCVPARHAGHCESISVNEHNGPVEATIVPGPYTLHQTFLMSAHNDNAMLKRPSAEFAPDPALDPQWINFFESFHGVQKDKFGFQVIVKVVPDNS